MIPEDLSLVPYYVYAYIWLMHVLIPYIYSTYSYRHVYVHTTLPYKVIVIYPQLITTNTF